MDDSKKSKGKNSSVLPVLDPVSATARVGVTSTDETSTGQAPMSTGTWNMIARWTAEDGWQYYAHNGDKLYVSCGYE